MIKPPKLHKGDLVAVLSPSSGLPSLFPHIFDNGIKTLESLGFQVKEYPTTRASMEFLSEHPELRAKDFNEAISDTSIKAIFTSIGGEGSIRILPYLDFEAIKNNPKLIIGFSDSTAFLSTIAASGVVTFYGPSLLAGFSQYNAFEESFHNHVETMLFESFGSYTYPTYGVYTEGFPDWGDKTTVGQILPVAANPGHRWLQGESAQGVLWGGCRALLVMLNGTQWWPKKEFFTGKILFFETSEEVPAVNEVRWLLRSLAAQGILNEVAGVIVGRAKGYTAEMKKELDETLLLLAKEVGRLDLPIMTGLDFGHTYPQWILPVGCKVKMSKQGLKLLENPFESVSK